MTNSHQLFWDKAKNIYDFAGDGFECLIGCFLIFQTIFFLKNNIPSPKGFKYLMLIGAAMALQIGIRSIRRDVKNHHRLTSKPHTKG